VISILIESDLLLAILKDEDRLKPIATRILLCVKSGEIKGVYASVAAIQEIVFWFHNRGLLTELSVAVNALIHLENVEWVGLTPAICLTASVFIDEYKISPFDAYHAATSMSKDRTILGTEHVYDKIRGIKRIDPGEFAKRL
jgi:predicted nucleic acid-binding protein